MLGFSTSEGRRGFGAKDHLCFAFNVGHLVQNILTLALANQGPHSYTVVLGVADDRLGQLGRQGFLDVVHVLSRHENASDCSAFLTAFDGHFFSDFFDEQIKFRGAGACVRTEHCGIQGVRLHIERNGVLRQPRMAFQKSSCFCRACERHHISFIDEIQDVSR